MKVIIQGTEAINELGKLEAEAKDLRLSLKDIAKENEGFKQLEVSAKNLSKQYVKLDETLKNHTSTQTLSKNKVEELTSKIQELEQAENKDEKQIKELNKQREFHNRLLTNSTENIDTTNFRIKENVAEMQKVQLALKTTSKFTQEYIDTNNKIAGAEKKIKELREEYGLSAMTMRQLKKYQSDLNTEIANVTYGTQAYKELRANIQAVTGVIQSQQNDLRDTRTSWQKFKDEMRAFGTATLGNIGGEIAMRAFDGMTQAIIGTVTQAAKLSDELADIQRFTGLSAEETKKLNSELSALNTRTGTGDLREITMIGGQLGVAKEEILGFVASIDKANVALSKEFGGSAEAVANALGKIKNLFAETKNMKFGEAMERIGSALTAAGASSSASAPQISDFAQRLGAIGELGGTLTETLGLGTGLLDLGLTSEIASSGLQALFITAGKESEAFAAQMGISVEQFKKLQNENPNKMLIDLAKSFKGLDNDEVLAGLLRMKITSGETVKVMALLKDNTEKVVSAQTLMSNEFNNNTKLQEAFNLKMTTFGAQVDLAKKEINGLVAGITSALLPAMTKIVEKTVAFVIILKELPKFLDENKYVIGALAVALFTLNFQMIAAQANALRMSFNMLVLRGTLGGVAIAQGALNVIMSLNPIGAVISAVALLVAGLAYLYNSNENVRKGVDTLWAAYKTFVSTYFEFWQKIFQLDFTGAFDTLINAFKKVVNIFSEGITPTINEPIGSKLITPQAKKAKQVQQMEEFSPFFETREKAPTAAKEETKISEEDVALIAANKKRAADAALADKADADKADAAAKQRADKLKEDRLKAEKEAHEVIAALKLELGKDEEQKEIAQAKLATAKSLEKYQELFDKKLISKKVFDEMEQVQQETLQQKLFEIDNKWRAKTAQEIAEANKKSFDEKLKNLENEKGLDDAQATLNDINAAADVADKFADTPELQDAALADLDYAQKQAALDREAEFLNQKLELYRENGQLTKELEDGFMAEQTAIVAQKTELDLAQARRLSKEKEDLRKKEAADIQKGLTLIGSAAGSISQSLQQLGIQNSAFGKALALSQIAISSGVAIAQSIGLAVQAAAAGGPAAPFLVAGYIASTLATVFAGISQAKSAIESAPTPTSTAKGAESGASGGGNSGYFDGGHHREAAGYTGGSSIYEPIPFIGHGGEYIIPNWMMRQTPIANFAGMLEGIRTNKTSLNSLYSQNQGNKTYFDGGMMTNTNSQSIDNQQNIFNTQIMQTMNILLEKVANVNVMPAKVVLRDITEANFQEQVLENDVKI